MATHGTVSAYEPGKEDWSTHIERLNHYFVANGVQDAAKKRAILLTACGASTYKLIRSLLPTAEAINTTSYADLVKLVKNYYEPAPSKIMQRWKFNTRNCQQGESIATYMAALRQLTEHCGYGESLAEMLRDRLVCGVNHDATQRRLLAEKDLTLDRAFELAQTMEAAERDTKDLMRGSSSGVQPQTPSVHHSQAGKSSSASYSRRADYTGRRDHHITCFRCGGDHLAPACKFQKSELECAICKKKGHIARVCKAKAQVGSTPHKKQPKRNHYLDADSADAPAEGTYSALFKVKEDSSTPITAQVIINDVPVNMEIDTGAAVTILNESTYKQIQQRSPCPLQKSQLILKTYTGESIQVLGTTTCKVRYSNHSLQMSVQVVQGAGPNLMGRDWLNAFEVSVHSVKATSDPALQALLQKHAAVYKDELGCFSGPKLQLRVEDNAKPRFFKPRTVPLILRDKVEAGLERLEKRGIISPVKHSKWAAPIVPIVKKNGTLRICGDYKVTVNLASAAEFYPLPRVEELFADLSGGVLFTKLDLAEAYLQLPLDDQSKEYLTINTHKGLFQFNRLPFGITSAPAIFQRTMETLLRGLKGVSVFIDDILLTGSTQEEHMQTLARVLERLEEANLRLNKDKCYYMKESIEFLGHRIDRHGLHPTEDKIKALRDAPMPKNVPELRSFLGIVNYYSKFLPNLSSKLSPLYNLLRKQSRWSWTAQHESAFQQAKNALQQDSLLVHFDPSKPIVLACDASQYGLGAVLSHTMDDGQERPIAYMSRTLNSAEKRYSQLEKEGLAIIFGVTKFHNYIYGRPFQIESDHQPLSYLFSEKRCIPQMASSRIQRWALTLSAYKYSIRYKPGKTLSNADALSRLPLPVTVSEEKCIPEDVVQVINHLSTTTANAANVRDWTNKDPVLSKVKRFLLSGWSEQQLGEDFKPYTQRKSELSLDDGCILWGTRVVIPPQGRKRVLEELHDTHQGASKMKSLARSYVWWPKLDAAIDNLVKKCNTCQKSRPVPPTAPLHPWEWPAKPWSRLHLVHGKVTCIL